jgi:hypothetical protein
MINLIRWQLLYFICRIAMLTYVYTFAAKFNTVYEFQCQSMAYLSKGTSLYLKPARFLKMLQPQTLSGPADPPLFSFFELGQCGKTTGKLLLGLELRPSCRLYSGGKV